MGYAYDMRERFELGCVQERELTYVRETFFFLGNRDIKLGEKETS